MTVVVLPTPPFWFVHAVTRTTSSPLRVQMGPHILPVSAVIGGLSVAYRGVAVGAVIHMFHVDHSGVRGRERAVYSNEVANVHGGAVISYIGPLLAVIVGIVHAAIAPVIVVGGV